MDDSSKLVKIQKEFEDYRNDKEREIASLEDELEELESKLSRVQQSQCDSLEASGATQELREENKLLKSKIEELEMKLEQRPDVSALEEQIRNLTAENDELNNELDENLEQMKTMKANLKKVRNSFSLGNKNMRYNAESLNTESPF